MPDFIQLCNAAYDPQTGAMKERADLDALWKALFGLDEWLFAMSPNDLSDPQPFMIQHNDEIWAFVFTDSEKLQEFATQNNLTGEGENAVYISLKQDDARDWIRRAAEQGLNVVHFNYGCPGWYSPVENLDRIHHHLFDGTP